MENKELDYVAQEGGFKGQGEAKFVPFVSDEVYNDCERLRTSDFISAYCDPFAYHHRKANGKKRENTISMSLGTKVHMAILESEKFKALIPVTTKTTLKEGYIGTDEMEICKGIADCLRASPNFVSAFKHPNTYREVGVLWEHDGVKIKSKVDMVSYNTEEDALTITDIKTFSSAFGGASESALKKKAVELGYYIQGEFYGQAILSAWESTPYASQTGGKLPRVVRCQLLFIDTVAPHMPHRFSLYSRDLSQDSMSLELLSSAIKAEQDAENKFGIESVARNLDYSTPVFDENGNTPFNWINEIKNRREQICQAL